jgi:nucleotide-binding universal stress UspA family protein
MPSDSQPLSRLLLPVDSLQTFQRVAPFAGLLIRTLKAQVQRVDMLHVIAGSFLSDHMNTIDVAAGEVPTPEDMRSLHQHYLDETATPLLLECRSLLAREARGYEPGSIIKDGDPVKTISSVCREGAYSTLIMSRRSLAGESTRLTGSVVSGVLHRHAESTIYLCGDEPIPRNESPFARCLIGVDGSPASKNAVTEAGMILSRVNDEIEQVYLVHVLDQSCYYDEDGVTCIQASLTGQQALEASGTQLIEAGVDPEKVRTVIHFGMPGTVLAEEVVGCDATLIFIGRRDRSRMAQVFLGSVCTDIVQNCRERTLVLSS